MKKLLTFLLVVTFIFSSYGVFADFDDIDNGTLTWAGDAIENLTKLGVINGYEDGTFRPGENVTRAEFSKMITAAFKLSCCSVTAYDDVSSHWANEYISSVGDLMYTSDGSFKPDKAATRADIAYCVAGVLKIELKDEEFIKKYSDYPDISEAMKAKVSAAVESGMMIGYDDMTLRPNGNVTRAEACVIVHRALNFKPDNPQEPADSKDHIYTLYPGKDILLLISANKTIDSKSGEDAVKLTYRIANSETEYTSVVPYDTKVTGIRTDIFDMTQGDVFIMNTAFHGYIGNLCVLASFADGVLNFDETVTGYGKGDYTLYGGKIKEMSVASRNTRLIVEWGGKENTVLIPNGIEANVFRTYNRNEKWELGFIVDVDPETEEEYVFIRCENGVATDVMVSDFVR